MNYAEDEKTIDLKQLLYYVLKRWKKILIFLLIGVLLGAGIAVLRGQKILDDLSSDEIKGLNLEKIRQYNHILELYELQKEKEEKSVLLQMDPNLVYQTSRSYYLTLSADDVNLISERYYLILSDTDVLDELIAASGLSCDHQAIQEIVRLYFSTLKTSTVWTQFGLKPVNAKVTLGVRAPSEEIGEALLGVLDAHVMTLQESLAKEYLRFSYEKLADNSEFGYDSSVRSAQEDFFETLKTYGNELVALKKDLTDNDLFYYAWTYTPDEIEFSLLKQIIKYAVLVGAVLCVLACGWYGVVFLLDDHIKTVQELADGGLYPIACLQPGDAKKLDFVDKLFANHAIPTNSREYLLNACKALCTGRIVLCGDAQDASTAEIIHWLASQMDGLCAMDLLTRDENGPIAVRESEGAILFIRLWKTTASQLQRELDIVKKTDKPVKGIVVLRD